MTGQRNDAVLDLDADVSGVNRGFPLQVCEGVLLHLNIGFHVHLSVFVK